MNKNERFFHQLNKTKEEVPFDKLLPNWLKYIRKACYYIGLGLIIVTVFSQFQAWPLYKVGTEIFTIMLILLIPYIFPNQEQCLASNQENAFKKYESIFIAKIHALKNENIVLSKKRVEIYSNEYLDIDRREELVTNTIELIYINEQSIRRYRSEIEALREIVYSRVEDSVL